MDKSTAGSHIDVDGLLIHLREVVTGINKMADENQVLKSEIQELKTTLNSKEKEIKLISEEKSCLRQLIDVLEKKILLLSSDRGNSSCSACSSTVQQENTKLAAEQVSTSREYQVESPVNENQYVSDGQNNVSIKEELVTSGEETEEKINNKSVVIWVGQNNQPRRTISPETKREIIDLVLRDGLGYSEVAQRLNLAKSTVSSIVFRCRKNQLSEDRRFGGGRRRTLTEGQEGAIVKLVQENTSLTLRELQQHILSNEDTFNDVWQISLSTLSRILKKHNMMYLSSLAYLE